MFVSFDKGRAAEVENYRKVLGWLFTSCGFGGNLRNFWICGVSAKTTEQKICTQIRRKQVNRGCL